MHQELAGADSGNDPDKHPGIHSQNKRLNV